MGDFKIIEILCRFMNFEQDVKELFQPGPEIPFEWDVKGFFQSGPEIPSRVKHKRWVYAFSSIDHENIDFHKVGKWLLFFDNSQRSIVTGLTQHDYVWQFIKKLTENDILYLAKCSTALQSVPKAYNKDSNGVICCYTVDYTNKKDVKRAANEIRRSVHCPSNLFYKTNNDTRAGKYRHQGDSHVSIYKYTAEREMYERDPVYKFQWNLVNV